MNLATGYSWRRRRAENIERFIEIQAFCGGMVRLLTHSLSLAPVSNLSLFFSLPVSPVVLADGGRGWARNQTIRPREAWPLKWPSSTHSSILSELLPVVRLLIKTIPNVVFTLLNLLPESISLTHQLYSDYRPQLQKSEKIITRIL
jgi:hypothetical protein